MTVCGECHNNHCGSARPCLCFDGHGVDRLGVEADMIMMEEVTVSSMMVMQDEDGVTYRTPGDQDRPGATKTAPERMPLASDRRRRYKVFTLKQRPGGAAKSSPLSNGA
ncbi:hypothetical protein E5D57_002131 [Metarhizium anisopliae]|nr:hypothetical protein E5D57_002131 [Metarhizium anisopliae]